MKKQKYDSAEWIHEVFDLAYGRSDKPWRDANRLIDKLSPAIRKWNVDNDPFVKWSGRFAVVSWIVAAFILGSVLGSSL